MVYATAVSAIALVWFGGMFVAGVVNLLLGHWKIGFVGVVFGGGMFIILGYIRLQSRPTTPESRKKRPRSALWHSDRSNPRTRTWRCPVCGQAVEVTGTGRIGTLLVSGSEVATLCTKQNGTSHTTRTSSPASPV